MGGTKNKVPRKNSKSAGERTAAAALVEGKPGKTVIPGEAPSSAPVVPARKSMERRAYQEAAFKAFGRRRLIALLWERQAGKSTTLADMALFEMMRKKRHTCIYASASLLLGQEIVHKQRQHADQFSREAIEKESRVLFDAAERYTGEVHDAGMEFRAHDAGKDKTLKDLKPEDFASVFESQNLEFRVYHDNGIFSRTKVIAPNVATARSWTGTVFLDEVAFIGAFRELMTALTPVVSTNPRFKLVLSTTPPQDDDTHYSFELLSPPAGLEFIPNPAGTFYESELGVQVHRADAYDTYLAGKKIYDLRTGREMTPDEAFAKSLNKDGHRINHLLRWMIGGSAACDLLRLKVAQERGIGQCATFLIDSDADFQAALRWLEEHAAPEKRVGLGCDVATTTGQKSNPTVLAVMEEHGPDYVYRAALVWKTRDPDSARERLRAVLRVIASRSGGRARALALDATNEKYFAEDVRKELRAAVPVLLVVGSAAVEKPGLEAPTNWKEYLGSQYVALLEDNRLTLPPEAYFRADHRLVRKEKGRFVCEPDEEGRHGDTFDAGKLAIHALKDGAAVTRAVAAGFGNYEEQTL